MSIKKNYMAKMVTPASPILPSWQFCYLLVTPELHFTWLIIATQNTVLSI